MNVLMAIRPRRNIIDEFIDNIHLVVDEESTGMELIPFHEMNVGIWKSLYNDFVMGKSGRFDLTDVGIHCIWFVFTGRTRDDEPLNKVRFFSFVLDMHPLRYTFTGIASESTYDDSEALFDHVAKSIRITPA